MRKETSDCRSPRILIVRLSAIGDVIHSMPVLCALRAAFPQSMLAWVVEERAAALLRGHSALDDLITLPRGWLRSPKTVWQLRRKLRSLAIDVTVDPQSLTKSAVAAWLSGARRRIGFGDEKGRELSGWLNTELVSTTTSHVIDSNLALLKPLGVARPRVEFGVPELEADATTAEELIASSKLEGGYAVINPGAGWPSKIWPPERHGAVAGYLGRMWGLPSLVVWAGAAERAMAVKIVSCSEGYAQRAPNTTLRELAAVLRRARLCVGSDTGPLHLAVAVGTPCVALHGTTSAQRNGPYGPQHRALQSSDLDAPLHRKRKKAPNELIKAISVKMVSEACDEILSGQEREAA